MNNFSFLVVGGTKESTETTESKKYVGVGSSRVLAVNPTKKELEAIYGTAIDSEPEYVRKEEGKPDSVRIDFIVRTDPEQCGGADIISHASVMLSNEGAYNRDGTKVQVIDEYGNTAWGNVDDVKAGRQLTYTNSRGEVVPCGIAPKYRPAFRGEAALVGFLKTFLGVESAFSYLNGTWVMREGNTDAYKFCLEHVKDYFHGDVSELKEALKLQPGNKVKLLYGVRTTDRGQYQTVCTREGFVLRNNAGTAALNRLDRELQRAKENGSFENTLYEVCPLREYVLETTNLSQPVETASDSKMPWD